MGLSTTTNRIQYTGNGAVDTYSYTFKIFAQTDLVVTVLSTSGTESTLVLSTDYTVTGVGESSGGTIVLVDASQDWIDDDGDLKTGYILTIRRIRPLTQDSDIRNQGDSYPETFEDEFDDETMVDQQQQEEIDRSLRLPISENATSARTTLPSLSDRTSNFLAFDASGNPIAAAGVTDVPVSAFMETVLDDTTAAAARTTLGAGSLTQQTTNIADIAALQSLFTYRRPVLQYVSATQVDVENNTGTANQTKIIFPDGDTRTVTENTSSTNQYRRFDITATATLSGTHDSGLASGLSEANNTWYAVYAVKTTDSSTNFVLAGSTNLPIQSEVSSLNTAFGTNGWVYLGLIRNGAVATNATDILPFTQAGNLTLFNFVQDNANLNGFARDSYGMRMASATGVASLTYTYSAGTGSTDIPNNIKFCIWIAGSTVATRELQISDQTINVGSSNSVVMALPEGQYLGAAYQWTNIASLGAGVGNSGSVNGGFDILLRGFYDGALGIASNPFI